ncbi:MAG: hypothetical protein ACRBFS_23710 [Aureispira sp.]
MKNIFLLLVGVFCLSTIQAQDEPLKGKKGQLILPESGDIGLGFNVIPFFNWFGNSFNNSTNNTYASRDKFFNVLGNNVVMGKYMLTEKTAARVHFGINTNAYSSSEFVQDDAANDPDMLVQDVESGSNGRYTLALGYEMRRGKGRIQGYYGADLVLNLNVVAESYTYGNGFSNTNAVPTSTNFGSNLNNGNGQRKLSDDGRTNFGIGVRPFVGLEYFVAPKVSVGAEFGWGIIFNTTFQSAEVWESFDPASGEVIIDTRENGASSNFGLNLDNMNGAVFMSFYF